MHHNLNSVGRGGARVQVAFAALTISVALASVTAAQPQRFSAVGDRLYYDATIPFPSNDARRITGTDESELFYYLEHDQGLRTVVLNADGGSVSSGTAMANVIAKFGVDTEVGGRCFSACTLVFLGGKHRSLAKGGVLGFHRSYVQVPVIDGGFLPTKGHPAFDAEDVADEYDYGEDAALEIIKFMLDHGVDIHFALKALRYERVDMWMPSRAELAAAGVLTTP